jgi:hypothetical protein
MATGRADYPIEPPVVSVLDDDASPYLHAAATPSRLTRWFFPQPSQRQLIRSFVEKVTARARTIDEARNWLGALAFGVFDCVGAVHPSLH